MTGGTILKDLYKGYLHADPSVRAQALEQVFMFHATGRNIPEKAMKCAALARGASINGERINAWRMAIRIAEQGGLSIPDRWRVDQALDRMEPQVAKLERQQNRIDTQYSGLIGLMRDALGITMRVSADATSSRSREGETLVWSTDYANGVIENISTNGAIDVLLNEFSTVAKSKAVSKLPDGRYVINASALSQETDRLCQALRTYLRAAGGASTIKVKIRKVKQAAPKPPKPERAKRAPGTSGIKAKMNDSRLPPVGTRLTAKYKGRTVYAYVREGYIEMDGKRYGSLSAAGRVITGGSNVNGFKMFGLT